MKRIADWFDQRIGYRGLVRGMLYEHIPGGARWRYVWGSTLVFCFVTQVITGIFLWMAYSPSSQTAWESVYYIQHEMSGGWLLRGIHHFMAQAMIVLLALHVMQVIIDSAYKAPREVNFWIGLILMQIVMGLSLTGYLLPWDQKGYWATKVATNLIGSVPFIGPSMQNVVVGGPDYGHHTLTRFFALHAGVLPGMLILFLVIHIYAFRRHGITAKLDEHKSLPLARFGNIVGLLVALALCYWLFRKPAPGGGPFSGLWPGVIVGGGIILLFWLVMLLTPPRRKDAHFWPDQVLKDAVACLAVLAFVIFLTFHFGAPLTAPADPTEQFSAARPEWYFLFLFQLLKYFPGELEIIGALVIPGAIMFLFVIMPFIGKTRPGHLFNVLVVILLMLSAGYLTFEALMEDAKKPEITLAIRQAEADGHRAVELAQSPTGIPTTGALALVREDPKTMGPRLFAANCASCHRYDGHDGLEGDLIHKLPVAGDLQDDARETLFNKLRDAGIDTFRKLHEADLSKIASLSDTERKLVEEAKPKVLATAADLKDFATKKWLVDFFDPKLIATHKYFGGTNFAEGKMVDYVKEDMADLDADDRKLLDELIDIFDKVAQWEGDDAMNITEANKTTVERGIELFEEIALSCADCHKFYGEGGRSGPDLTGYRTKEWIRQIIRDPKHVGYKNKVQADGTVADKDNLYTMPAFKTSSQLDDQAIDLLARWLRGEWYEPKAAE